MTTTLARVSRTDGHTTGTVASTWSLLADLPVQVDDYATSARSQQGSDAARRTTVVRLEGGGTDGVGEDATPFESAQVAFQAAPCALAVAGDWTLASFSAYLDTLDLHPHPVALPHPQLRHFRQWAFESAALDLALRQAGRSLASILGRPARPVTFVNSLRAPERELLASISLRLELHPELRFKLDPMSTWDHQLIAELASTGAVDTLDLKGLYPPQAPIAQPADPDLYRRVAEGFPACWIEDPALTPATEDVLRPHRNRITWDFPIHTVSDIEALPFTPTAINVKPGRIGRLQALLDLYDHCAAAGIGLYGGGMGELGPGREQLQYLASLFHPDAPNDIAPPSYNLLELSADTPASPLEITPAATGFRLVGVPQPEAQA
jgi:L-alanine-DL-glutamate epimerase-like enolase superfamily enzyme